MKQGMPGVSGSYMRIISLLRSCRHPNVAGISTQGESDFGDCLHTTLTNVPMAETAQGQQDWN